MMAHSFYRRAATCVLIALIALTFFWEWNIAPLRPSDSWLALKALPLCLPLSGILKGKIYTFQYSTMLVLPYLAEGVMRLTDLSRYSRLCAAAEIVLVLVFFVLCIAYIRTQRRS